jgi:hypothetical protein
MRNRAGLVLLAITMIGGVLRSVAAATHSAHISTDQRAYSLLALELSEHGRYGSSALSGPFHWPPGAPLLFAAANLFDPAHISAAHPRVPAAYVAQVLVGTALIPAAAWIAGTIAGRAAAIGAAALVALYPPLVLSAGELLSEPLGALLITLAVAAAVWGTRADRLARLIPCGVLLGLTALTRADLLLAPVAVAIAVAAWRRRVAAGAAILGVAALTAAPWVAFVASRKHALVPVTTGGGSNLFIGTYLPGHGTIFGLKRALGPTLRAHHPSLRGVPDFKLSEERILLGVAGGHRGSQDAYLRDRGALDAWRYARTQPLAFAGMLASKAGRLWLDYTHGSLHPSEPLARAGHIALMVAAVALLVAGLVLAPALALVVIATLLVLATALNSVLVSEPRHLLTLLPLLFAGGAGGAVIARRRMVGAAA